MQIKGFMQKASEPKTLDRAHITTQDSWIDQRYTLFSSQGVQLSGNAPCVKLKCLAQKLDSTSGQPQNGCKLRKSQTQFAQNKFQQSEHPCYTFLETKLAIAWFDYPIVHDSWQYKSTTALGPTHFQCFGAGDVLVFCKAHKDFKYFLVFQCWCKFDPFCSTTSIGFEMPIKIVS